jgi:hypothetical protein
MPCPTCGCALHAMPRTWPTRCAVCGHEKWPSAVAPPATPYVCALCLGGNRRAEAARDRVQRLGGPLAGRAASGATL